MRIYLTLFTRLYAQQSHIMRYLYGEGLPFLVAGTLLLRSATSTPLRPSSSATPAATGGVVDGDGIDGGGLKNETTLVRRMDRGQQAGPGQPGDDSEMPDWSGFDQNAPYESNPHAGDYVPPDDLVLGLAELGASRYNKMMLLDLDQASAIISAAVKPPVHADPRDQQWQRDDAGVTKAKKVWQLTDVSDKDGHRLAPVQAALRKLKVGHPANPYASEPWQHERLVNSLVYPHGPNIMIRQYQGIEYTNKAHGHRKHKVSALMNTLTS